MLCPRCKIPMRIIAAAHQIPYFMCDNCHGNISWDDNFLPPDTQKTFVDSNNKTDDEICICAAVKATDGTIIRGHRHRDCRDGIIRRGKKPSKRWEDEGFITSTGRFVTREQGMKLMADADWISKNPEGYQSCGWLFSEDLY